MKENQTDREKWMKKEILDLCTDFYEWPIRWHGVKEDIVVGRRILACFEPYVTELCQARLTKKTKKRHIDNLWLIGGEIVWRVSVCDEYQGDIERIVRESVDEEGEFGSRHLQAEDEIRSFKSTCRKLAKHFKETTKVPDSPGIIFAARNVNGASAEPRD